MTRVYIYDTRFMVAFRNVTLAKDTGWLDPHGGIFTADDMARFDNIAAKGGLGDMRVNVTFDDRAMPLRRDQS